MRGNSSYPRASGGRVGPAISIFLIYFHHNTVKKSFLLYFHHSVYGNIIWQRFGQKIHTIWNRTCVKLFLLFSYFSSSDSYFFLETIPTFFLLFHQRPLSSLPPPPPPPPPPPLPPKNFSGSAHDSYRRWLEA